MKLSKKVKKLIQKTARDHVNIALQVASYLPENDFRQVADLVQQNSREVINLIYRDMLGETILMLECDMVRIDNEAQTMPNNNGVNLKKMRKE